MIVDIRFKQRDPLQIQNVRKTQVFSHDTGFGLIVYIYDRPSEAFDFEEIVGFNVTND